MLPLTEELDPTAAESKPSVTSPEYRKTAGHIDLLATLADQGAGYQAIDSRAHVDPVKSLAHRQAAAT
jgi:hypothetical protein